MHKTRSIHQIIFKLLREPQIGETLRQVVRIRASAVPVVLFKTLFRYPLYGFVLLLFVENIRDLTELILFRDAVRVLDLRFGLGQFRLNVDEALLLAASILRGMLCYSVGDRVFVRFHGGWIPLINIRFLSITSEPFEKMYHVFHYTGKVLDVGGGFGETAFLFKKWGASEVVVYEPDHISAQHARETMCLNGVKGVVHESFVNCSCSHKSTSWVKVLEEKFDIAKVDCEGCENGLLSLPDDYLRKVPKWVIECHGHEIFRRMGEKFLRAGFTVTFRPYGCPGGYCIFGYKRIFHHKAKIPEIDSFIMSAHLP